ncbi:M48 family metalloprotease [Neisseriaceae bacterium PsAf]|nr:M48 family metalloprotease [Neisseriaceae bacterium PsAf]
MKKTIKKSFLISIISSVFIVSGCSSIDTSTAVGLGVSALGVMSVTDQDIVAMSNDACQQMDRKSTVLPDSAPESVRIRRIAGLLDQSIVGQPVNFKVYQSKNFNAFALPNGCIRVNSAQLDKFTDEELASVIGHEMGHVALKHAKNQFKTMNMLYIGLQAGGASSKSSIINSPAFQNIVMSLTNGQYSQRQELEADEYAIAMLKRRNLNPYAMVTMLEKIQKLYGSGSPTGPLAYFSSHPNNQTRINAAMANINGKSSRASIQNKKTNSSSMPQNNGNYNQKNNSNSLEWQREY